MKISKCKVIWSIKSRIFKQKTVLTKISLNSHSTKKRSRFRHPYRFMNLDFLGHFGILVNRSFSSAPGSMTFLTFGTYVINCRHPNTAHRVMKPEYKVWNIFVHLYNKKVLKYGEQDVIFVNLVWVIVEVPLINTLHSIVVY